MPIKWLRRAAFGTAVGLVLWVPAAGAVVFAQAPGSPLTVGTNPRALVVADFNGDGFPDIAVANFGSGGVAVLLGDGSGGFTAASGSPLTVGNGPTAIATGDFNGDGFADLAVANSIDGTVSILLGDGSGGFTAASGSPVTVGNGPTAIATGDFNGDGFADLAVANSIDGTVSILLGDGSGGFTAASGSPVTVGNGPTAIATGDFNGDGFADLAVANSIDGTVSILLGDGSGGFTAASGSPVTVGNGPTAIATGDFNGDGNRDVATADAGNDTFSVLLGSGSGGFAPASSFPVGNGTVGVTSIATGDFNSDGVPDIVVAGSTQAWVFDGDGSGGFPTSNLAVSGLPATSRAVAVSDLNGDGHPDFAIAGDGGLSIILDSPPNDTIAGGPSSPTFARSASFNFSSNDSTSTFKCSLDGASFTPCTSPVSYSGLSTGLHTFQVQATNDVGLTDPTPASQNWTIAPPDTNLNTGPSSPTYATSAAFSFSSHDSAATFQCSLDGASPTTCTSPKSYSGLSTGSHSFTVHAVDQGAVDPVGANQTWTIAPPDTNLNTGPSSPTYATSAAFSFSSHDSAATFQCSLDGASPTTCTSPKSYSGLSTGSHSFTVHAVDQGAVDPVGANQTWTIAPPDTKITGGPPSATRSARATFSFFSDDTVATFQCNPDGLGWSACSSPYVYSGLSGGHHTFTVRAVNDTGAPDPTGATKTWDVDLTTPPVAQLSVSSPVLTGNHISLDASASHDALDGTIVDYQWDLGGGTFALDTGSTPTTSASFTIAGQKTVRVKVTNEVGGTAIATASVNVDPAPPSGPIGVSIDNGDYATNSTSVQLRVVWPAFTSQALVSNDGGFDSAGGTQVIPVATTVPWAWALLPAGNERLPKTVYVRFPDSAHPNETFTDDIILDTTTPQVQKAKFANIRTRATSAYAGRRAFKIRLHATEKVSGISKAQFSRSKDGGATAVFRNRNRSGLMKVSRLVSVVMTKAPRWVRVQSAAGNWSNWHHIG